jgi:hypothetical protein
VGCLQFVTLRFVLLFSSYLPVLDPVSVFYCTRTCRASTPSICCLCFLLLGFIGVMGQFRPKVPSAYSCGGQERDAPRPQRGFNWTSDDADYGAGYHHPRSHPLTAIDPSRISTGESCNPESNSNPLPPKSHTTNVTPRAGEPYASASIYHAPDDLTRTPGQQRPNHHLPANSHRHSKSPK